MSHKLVNSEILAISKWEGANTKKLSHALVSPNKDVNKEQKRRGEIYILQLRRKKLETHNEWKHSAKAQNRSVTYAPIVSVVNVPKHTSRATSQTTIINLPSKRLLHFVFAGKCLGA
uniref:Uncharacterized protein n=1 Tax=Onchocerca volvulus TaxID=6282 RepID=A0A8R1XWJ8_ONCVO